MDRMLRCGGDPNRILAVGGLQHAVATLLENAPDEIPERRLILDDEHRLRARHLPERSFRRERRRFARALWKKYGEGRAESRRARYLNLAIGLLDDAVHGREPESRAATDLLRSEEGLKDSLARHTAHPDPRVGDRQSFVWNGNQARVAMLVMRHGRRADDNAPSSRHRVACVDREIDDH